MIVILAAILFFFLIVSLFKWLWNITMPLIFNLKTVTYWQAFRLILIASILFGPLGQPLARWQDKKNAITQAKLQPQSVQEASK